MSIFSKIAVTDEERAAKAKEVMKAIASFSNSQNKQEYLYSYVPRAGIAQIKEHGLLSGNEIAKPENRHLLEIARPNGDADRWLKEKDERLAKDPWKTSYDGPSVLFGDLDPDKIHDKHPIKKFDTARIKIKLTDLLKDYPDTRMEGSELIPYTSNEAYDALDEKGKDEFVHNRHHTLSPEEIKALIVRGQNPKDMWKDFKDTEGKFYASDVPHAHLITSIGKIPSKYIEFDEEQPVIKQAGLLKAANIKTTEDKVSADWFMDTVDRDPHPDAKIVSLKPMPSGQFVFHGSNRKLSLLDIAHATTRNYGPGKEKAYEYTHPVVFASKTPSSLFTTEEVGEHKNLVDSGKRRVYHMITEGDRKLYLGTRQAGHISVLDSDGFYEAHRRLFKGGKWVDIYEVVKPSNAKVVESIPGSPFDWESIPDYEYVPAIGGRTTTLEEYLSHAKDPKVIAGIKEHLAKGPFVPQIPEALKKYLASEAKQAAPLKTMNLFTKLAFALNAIGPEKLQDVLQPKKNPVTIKEFRLMLYPKDFEASRNFYEKHLQFPVMHSWDEGDDDKGVMFNLGGTTLELMSPEKNKHNVSSPTHLSLAVPDVHKLWEQMKDGDNIIHPIRNNSWGDTSFAISDPEGHRLIFYSPNKLNKQAGKLSNLEKVVKDSIHEYKSSNPTMRILSQNPVADREFLYHASGKKFDMLDPKFNSKKVFGHEFTVPVVFAGDSSSSAFAATPTAEYQAVKDKVNDFVYHRLHDEETGRKALLGHTAGGYLYKLPASAFTKVIREDHELGKWDKSTEYLSHKPVKPISVTPIQSTDVDAIPEYEYLGQDFVGEMPAQHYLNNAKDPKVIAAVQAWLANNKKGLVKKQASLLSKLAAAYTASGEKVQGVGLRKMYHSLLEEQGLPGLAVNNEETGDVELSFDGDEAKRKEIFDQLSSRVKAKTGHPITFTPTANPQVSVPINLSNIDAEKLNAIHHLAYRMSKVYNPNDSAMDSNNSFKEKIADRFRLQVNQRGLQGTVPSRASEQLSGNRPMYDFMLPDQRTRSEEEALSDMPKDQKRRLMKALLGGRGFLDPNQTKVAEAQPRHELVIGASGAGKTTKAKELSEQNGMPVINLDKTDPAWHNFIKDNDNLRNENNVPFHLIEGTKTNLQWKKLMRRIVDEAIAKKKPHIIEGTHLMMLSPKELQNHNLHIVNPSLEEVVQRRENRMRQKEVEKGWHYTKDDYENNRLFATAFYDKIQPAIKKWEKVDSKLKNRINPKLVAQINSKVAALLSPLSSINYNPKI